jgi:hypothetical protein
MVRIDAFAFNNLLVFKTLELALKAASESRPIVITLYLLIRFEKKISDLSEAINALKNEIQKNVKK